MKKDKKKVPESEWVCVLCQKKGHFPQNCPKIGDQGICERFARHGNNKKKGCKHGPRCKYRHDKDDSAKPPRTLAIQPGGAEPDGKPVVMLDFTCKDCSDPFQLTEPHRDWFLAQNMSVPVRCQKCLAIKKADREKKILIAESAPDEFGNLKIMNFLEEGEPNPSVIVPEAEGRSGILVMRQVEIGEMDWAKSAGGGGTYSSED